MDESKGEDKREIRLARTLFLWESDISWKDVLIRWVILCGLSTVAALFLHFIGWVGPGGIAA